MPLNPITEKDRKKILDLFYNSMYNEASLEEYFKGKYHNSQIKQVIRDSYKNYTGVTITKMPANYYPRKRKKNKIS